ncbi:hypothetical protein I3760_02G124900 [Carya illinoinensis]|uniref:Uncharacterized protein n=1 Tax=Carya illinoinensis TaxID=32201 RepID=A0A922K0X9_CARIL|nr:uncharacterized protein LOC122300807 [Carya illinoinensis]KAG2722359.1 hypothetical protein I3760_02G124900 [Carya illinoinensis]KAG6727295.1 hypothetical protein I3842_02G122900 [Carya illinoinensis]
MEGLIPMVYKAIKRNRVRRKYRCLSSGDAQSYNIADFYINDQSHVYTLPSTQKIGGGLHIERNGHRRHSSVGDYGVGFSPPEGKRMESAPAPKGLVRFRSHRLFSCVTGGI